MKNKIVSDKKYRWVLIVLLYLAGGLLLIPINALLAKIPADLNYLSIITKLVLYVVSIIGLFISITLIYNKKAELV